MSETPEREDGDGGTEADLAVSNESDNLLLYALHNCSPVWKVQDSPAHSLVCLSLTVFTFQGFQFYDPLNLDQSTNS